MKRIVFIFLLFVSLALPAKEKMIVTSFYPIYIETLNIIEGVKEIKLVNMTKPFTGCLHDYQLTPQDLITLAKAEAFVVNGAGMEAFLQKVITRQKNLTIVEASKGISLEGDNPHVWLNPLNAISQVENIANGLSEKFPEHKKTFLKNAKDYSLKLFKLNEIMKAETKVLKGRTMITFHEAFPYFAKAFDFKIAAVIEREPGTEPTAKELVAIMTILKKLETKVIFAEPQYSAKSAQAIAKQTGAKIYPLDPLVTGEMNKDAYLLGMQKNLEVLKEAFK